MDGWMDGWIDGHFDFFLNLNATGLVIVSSIYVKHVE